MAPLKPFWDAQTFGVVHAVGMAQPNRSHFDAMEEMERRRPAARSAPDGSTGAGPARTGHGVSGDADGIEHRRVVVPRADPELAMYDIDSFNLDGVGRHGTGQVDTALRALNVDAPAA